VTGGASGIGRALGAALAARGDDVVLTDVDGALLGQVVRELRDEVSGSLEAAELDVRDEDAVRELVGEVRQQAGRIDYLFNNAGIAVGGEMDEIGLPAWERIVDVNLRGVVHGVAAVYPLMLRQGHGHIVNTASLAGLIPAPLLTPYATTSHAIVGLTLSLRAEAGAHGVRVSAVCPGGVDTPLLDAGGPADLAPAPSFVATDLRAFLRRVGGALHSPEALVRDVLHDLDRDRALIVTPRPARMLWRLHRALPPVVERLLRYHVGRERRIRAAGDRTLDPELRARTP
jgi:NAD(P)-dependent dehydrogenase (short-subunit alcohol dehydrogenase family)